MARESQIPTLLRLTAPPVAVGFQDTPPSGMRRVSRSAAAGCGYWKLAQEGEAFYTEAEDHFGCPVGAHTQHVELPAEKAAELQGLVETMVGLEYLRMEEVPNIPRRETPLRYALYAPLDGAPFEPEVVLVRGTARQIMLLTEAAQSADYAPEAPAMGRPACCVIPEALTSGRPATSLGCIGNRVYTGLPDDEFYFAIPGPALSAIEARLGTIVHANEALEAFHRHRLAAAG